MNTDFLPISLNIANKPIAIIGGGTCALQKTRVLVQFTRNITIVAPVIDPAFEELGITLLREPYKTNHVRKAFLVYACTDNTTVNELVASDCAGMGKLCNRADKPGESDFHSPAIARTENYIIGINSLKREPKKTVRLRDKIETLLDIYDQGGEPEKGKVYLVGFGPGNPELMTIKAHRLLFDADVILYDDLLDSKILDKYRGVKEYVGKRRDNHAKEQNEINDILLRYAREGNMVVRLKGGDPFIFGRGSEEKKYLEDNGVSVDIVPGITSAIAAAAYSSIPLTHRGISSSVAFGTAHGKNSFKILDADTSVYYMGAGNIKDIARRYLDAGYPAHFPVAVVYNASMPDQAVTRTTITRIVNNEHEFKSPVISIFGNTVNWQELA